MMRGFKEEMDMHMIILAMVLLIGVFVSASAAFYLFSL